MIRKSLVMVFAVAFAAPAFADQRGEKIQALMKAQGLVKTFEQQMSAGRDYGRKQSRAVLDEMLKGLNPSPEYRERFEGAASEFMQALEPPWSAKEVVDVWARYYGEAFSDAELESLLAFYTSPLAQREIVVGREAMTKFTAYFQEKYKPLMEAATAAYVQKLQAIARDCKCRR